MAKRRQENLSYKQQFTALGNLPRFFNMIWEASRPMAITNIFLRLLKSAVPLLMLYIGKEIIDEVLALIDQPGEMNRLWLLVGLELGLAVFSELMNRAITLLDSLLGDLLSNTSSEQLIRHAATLDLYQFEDSEFYDKLERARRQTTGRTVLMSMVLTQIQEFITILFLAGGLIAFNPWLLLILAIAVIPSFLGETHFNQRTYSLTTGWTPERRELDYLRYIGASDETAKEVKIFNLADFLADRFKEISDKYFKVNSKLAISRASWGALLSAIGTLAYYGAYVFILIQTVGGIITVGTLTFLAGSFQRMRGMLQSIMNRFSKIAEQSLYLQDLFDFFELKPQISTNGIGRPIPSEIKEGFVFENVGFKYFNSEKWAIRNLSFHLKKGEKMALVGENGAGKTTLVKLLARLYEPTEGRILLDGVDLKEYNLKELRNAIGIIFQDYIRFQMKASENIAIGNIGKLEEKPIIETAAQKKPCGYSCRRFAKKNTSRFSESDLPME